MVLKKPLILLVDDDAAVVESLEASLSPAFVEIARVEAFTDPGEVLAQLPRWAEEKRSIAIAIVDQKMPHLTGIELVERLRAEARNSPPGVHPATRMEAVLLTGYAGLASALEAANLAGIARYLEKPWRGAELVETVRDLLRKSFEDSGIADFYSAREATRSDDVADALECRLTHARLSFFIRQAGNTRPASSIDQFDRTSRFVALRRGPDRVQETMGSMRMAGQDTTEASQAFDAFIANRPELDPGARDATTLPLPLFQLASIGEQARPFVEELTTQGESVVEPGAIAVRPAASNPAGIVRLLSDTAMAGMSIWRIDNALVACSPAQGLNYRRLGFVPAPHTKTHSMAEPAPSFVCLWGRPDSVPTNEIAFSWIIDRLRRTGTICRCAAFPECVPEPFVGGGTGMSDLFCPRLASKIIMGSD